MIVLVSGATADVPKMPAVIGRLYEPRGRNAFADDGRPWAIDNAAFSGFDEGAFWTLLGRLHDHRRSCLFVAAPDVVGKAAETLVLFARWSPIIRRMGYPVALVGQDGLTMDAVPWRDLDAVFIGGTTEWKLSQTTMSLCAYGRALGKWVHMGRVNSLRRLKQASRFGCQSVDGSGWSKWPKTRLPMAVDWLDAIARQECLL